MLPDPPDQFSEKPFLDFDQPVDRPASAPDQGDFPGRSIDRYTRNLHYFLWDGPTGPVTVTVTDYVDYFGTRHSIEIDIPRGTLFPLDDLSLPVGHHEITRAGDAVALVQSLLASVEALDFWKDAAARARQGDLFGAGDA